MASYFNKLRKVSIHRVPSIITVLAVQYEFVSNCEAELPVGIVWLLFQLDSLIFISRHED